MGSPLRYEVTDGLCEVTLDRPDRLNALDDELIDGLTHAFARAATDDAVRAVLLTGSGRGFCAGADLKFMMERALSGQLTEPAPAMFWRIAGRMHDGIATLKHMRKPTIAAVNGPCAGADMGYALACDVVWAAQEATFRLAYTNIGLAPDAATTYLVTRLIGEKRALELFYSAEKLTASHSAWRASSASCSATSLALLSMVIPRKSTVVPVPATRPHSGGIVPTMQRTIARAACGRYRGYVQAA